MATNHTDALAVLTNEKVRIIPPDYALKKIIGEDVDVQQLLNPKNVEKAQHVILEHTHEFLDWVKQDIATLEHSYREAVSDPSACESSIKKLARTAFVIKSQAGTFGFELATYIAKSLDDFCNQHFKPIKEHMIVIRKHIDALSLIFHKNITGDGDSTGRSLMDGFSKLVDKYK